MRRARCRIDREAERRHDPVLILHQHDDRQTERTESHQRESERSENVDHDMTSLT
jgi:hypothetical protein